MPAALRLMCAGWWQPVPVFFPELDAGEVYVENVEGIDLAGRHTDLTRARIAPEQGGNLGRVRCRVLEPVLAGRFLVSTRKDRERSPLKLQVRCHRGRHRSPGKRRGDRWRTAIDCCIELPLPIRPGPA